jgi:transcriptional regulator with XRE-family HTH domain
MKAFTKEQVIKALRKAQGDRTAKDFAASIGVSQAYLSDVYHGRREPGPSILSAIGLQRVYASQQEARP